MLGQRLANLDADTAKVGDLAQIQEVLHGLKRTVLNTWSAVYGSEVAKGRDVVLEGLNQDELNGMTGTVESWDDEQERWVVDVYGQNKLLKDDKVFAMDGLVGKIAVVYREVLRETFVSTGMASIGYDAAEN